MSDTRPADRGEAALNLRRFPIDLKAQFKAWCASRGWPMEVVAEALMLDCIEQDRRLASLITRVQSQRRARTSGRTDSIHSNLGR